MKKKLLLIAVPLVLVIAAATVFFTVILCKQTVIIDGTPVDELTKYVFYGQKIEIDEKLEEMVEKLRFDNSYCFRVYVNDVKVPNVKQCVIKSDVEIRIEPIIEYYYEVEKEIAGETVHVFDGVVDDPKELDSIVLPEKDGRKFLGWEDIASEKNLYVMEYIDREVMLTHFYIPVYQNKVSFVFDGKEVSTAFVDGGGTVTPPELGQEYICFGWAKENEAKDLYHEYKGSNAGWIEFEGNQSSYNFYDFSKPIDCDTVFVAYAIKCNAIRLETDFSSPGKESYSATKDLTCKVGMPLNFALNTYLRLYPLNLKVYLGGCGKYSNCKFTVDDLTLVEYDEQGIMMMKKTGKTMLTIDFGGVTTRLEMEIVDKYPWEDSSYTAYGYLD